MEENIQENIDIGRDPKHKNNKNCVINIFCGDKKHDCDHGNKEDDHCTINIFCNEKKPDDHSHCDDKKHDDKW